VEKTQCRECGGDVPPAKARGRPGEYCSTACRRLREFRIRRVTRELAGLESLLRQTRHGRWYGSPAGRTERIGELGRLIADAEQRLRTLLEGGADA
jgi:hypothetical protein